MESEYEIIDESTDGEKKFALMHLGARKATLVAKHGDITFHWQVYGPQYWPVTKPLIQGLLDLSIIADQLMGERND